MHPDSNAESDLSSSCSTASPGGDTPGCSQHPPDSSSSSVDSVKEKENEDRVPPTKKLTSQRLKSLARSAVITSASPSSSRAQSSRSHSAPESASPVGGKKAKLCNKKVQREQPSKEEEEKRRIRRERNKIAAAKCRNKRRELIDTLQAETDELEEEKSTLQTEIANLLKEKERLENVLESHKSSCKVPENKDQKEESKEGGNDEMMQEPPVSPQLLSELEDGEAASEEKIAIVESLISQDMDNVPCFPSAAILGNSNILLCSSAKEEVFEELKGDDLDDLVPSLEMAVTSEVAASVPDIDLSGPFCLSDWETLYKSVANDLESLCTPVMSSSPSCSNYRTVFSFNYSEIDSLAEGCEYLKGSLSTSEMNKASLNSPTLLAL